MIIFASFHSVPPWKQLFPPDACSTIAFYCYKLPEAAITRQNMWNLRVESQICQVCLSWLNRSCPSVRQECELIFTWLVEAVHAIFFKWDSAPWSTSLSLSFTIISDSFWPLEFPFYLSKLANSTSICPWLSVKCPPLSWFWLDSGPCLTQWID